jgi:sacsin
MLLFLKSVECIEIMVWDVGQTEPRMVYGAEIMNSTSELKRQRLFVGNAIRSSNAATAQAPGAGAVARRGGDGGSESPVDFTLQIRCSSSAADASTDGNARGEESCRTEHWEVCNQLGGPAANAIAFDPDNTFLRLVPWAGVAACVTEGVTGTGGGAGGGGIKDGLAYCFLPLPVQTGLPVMVNGFFELSSNRRDVWQEGVDMTGDGRTRAAWNLALMSDVIGPSYCRLLRRLRDAVGFTDRYQQFWPSDKAPHPWRVVSQSALQHCRPEPLLRRQLSFPAGTGAPESRGWVPCEQAVLLPVGRGALSATDEAALTEVLVVADCPFVNCTPSLREVLISSGTCSNVSDSKYVRQILRKRSVSQPRSSAANGGYKYIPPKRLCGFLCRYCTADVSPAELASLGCLDSLLLLPLSTAAAEGGGKAGAGVGAGVGVGTGVGVGVGRSVGCLRVYSPQQVSAADTLSAMGFPLSAVLAALSAHAFSVDAAMDALMDPASTTTTTTGATAGAADATGAAGAAGATSLDIDEHALYILCSDAEELHLFRRAEGILIDRSYIGPNELEFLAEKHILRSSNVRRFHPGLAVDVLRRILPTECFAPSSLPLGVVVAVADGQPRRSGMAAGDLMDFVQSFWAFSKTHPEVIAAVAEGPCLVPTRAGRLLPLSKLSFVLSPASVPESIQGILERLGLRVLDAAAVPDAGAMPGVFWEYLYPSSRAGLLRALHSLLAGASAAAVAERFAPLAPADRAELLAFLSSCEAIRSFTGEENTVMNSCDTRVVYFLLYFASCLIFVDVIVLTFFNCVIYCI